VAVQDFLGVRYLVLRDDHAAQVALDEVLQTEEDNLLEDAAAALEVLRAKAAVEQARSSGNAAGSCRGRVSAGALTALTDPIGKGNGTE
jgi:hypothetical protein